MEESRHTIRLQGDLAGWLGGYVPASVQGSYFIHGESLQRGAKHAEWTDRDGGTWHMAYWNLWCYRKGERNALRVYLQLLVNSRDADAYTAVFPSAITFRQLGEGYFRSEEVEVEFGSTDPAKRVTFRQGIYVWRKPYATVRPCVEEQPGPEGDPEPVLMKPGDRFNEEAVLLEQLVRHGMETELTDLHKQLEGTGGQLDRARRGKAELRRRIADLENRLSEWNRDEVKESALDALQANGSPFAASVWILNLRGWPQRRIAKELELSLGTVHSILDHLSADGLAVSRGRGGAGMHTIKRARLKPKMTAQTMARKEPGKVADPRYTSDNLYGQVDRPLPAADTTPELNT
jgi:hypothetical protein